MNPYLLHRRKAFRQTGDPFWANVVFLQNFQGTNGSKPATDQSQYAHALAWNGDAVISTVQSPFAGGSSLALDGAGDRITMINTALLMPGSGDFTIEAWIYPTTQNQFRELYSTYNGLNTDYFLFGVFNDNTIHVAANASLIGKSTGTTSLNQWQYVAYRRSGNTLTFWRGVSGSASQIGSATTSHNFSSSRPVAVGAGSNGEEPFSGFIGPMRITKGIARNVSTVPTAPFPTGP